MNSELMATGFEAVPRDQSAYIIRTLGPKVYKYDLLWAIWSPWGSGGKIHIPRRTFRRKKKNTHTHTHMQSSPNDTGRRPPTSHPPCPLEPWVLGLCPGMSSAPQKACPGRSWSGGSALAGLQWAPKSWKLKLKGFRVPLKGVGVDKAGLELILQRAF